MEVVKALQHDLASIDHDTMYFWELQQGQIATRGFMRGYDRSNGEISAGRCSLTGRMAFVEITADYDDTVRAASYGNDGKSSTAMAQRNEETRS